MSNVINVGGDRGVIPEEVFIVNISMGQTGFVADKTFEEVRNAVFTEGKNCIAKVSSSNFVTFFTLVQINTEKAYFSNVMGSLISGMVTTLIYDEDGLIGTESPLPPSCGLSDAGKILTVDSEGDPAWTAITNAEGVAY